MTVVTSSDIKYGSITISKFIPMIVCFPIFLVFSEEIWEMLWVRKDLWLENVSDKG